MKKRPWKVRRRYVEQPDARSRWDRSYQSLIQWREAVLKDQSSSPLIAWRIAMNMAMYVRVSTRATSTNTHNRAAVITARVSTVKNRDGNGMRSTFFATMGTAERVYAVQGSIVYVITYAMLPLIGCW
jgi:hypothetical protein